MARIMDREVRFAFLIHDVSRLRRVMFDRIVRNLGVVRGIVVRSRNVFVTFGANLQTLIGGDITLFTQLDNLLGQQHIGPIGYPGLPFTIRAGMKFRIGSN